MNANPTTLAEGGEGGTGAPGRRRNILLLIAAVFVLLGVGWAVLWVLVLSLRERTDDAYVNGNKVVLSAQVQGTVVAVLTDDTQFVTAGQVLVRLDPVDAQVGLARSENALAQTVRQVRQQALMAEQYDSMIESRRLELARAEEDLVRTSPSAFPCSPRTPSRRKTCAMRARASSSPARLCDRPRVRPPPRMPWWTVPGSRTTRACSAPKRRFATRG